MLILNGRTQGDLSGLCTYHKHECRTTVDYLIAASGLFGQAVELVVRNGSALHCNTESYHHPVRLKIPAHQSLLHLTRH